MKGIGNGRKKTIAQYKDNMKSENPFHIDQLFHENYFLQLPS